MLIEYLARITIKNGKYTRYKYLQNTRFTRFDLCKRWTERTLSILYKVVNNVEFDSFSYYNSVFFYLGPVTTSIICLQS